jgi:hypothetical protein
MEESFLRTIYSRSAANFLPSRINRQAVAKPNKDRLGRGINIAHKRNQLRFLFFGILVYADQVSPKDPWAGKETQGLERCCKTAGNAKTDAAASYVGTA